MRNFLLQIGLKGADINHENEKKIEEEVLKNLVLKYASADDVISRLSSRIQPVILKTLIQNDELDFQNPEKALYSAKKLKILLAEKGFEVNFQPDPNDQDWLLIEVEGISHGNRITTSLDKSFFASGEYKMIHQAAKTFAGILDSESILTRDNKSIRVNDFSQVLSWLIGEAKRVTNVQRYKGLGEMNPDQLWETTMDPENRTLLQTEIWDQSQQR